MYVALGVTGKWRESLNKFEDMLERRALPLVGILASKGPDELVDECNVLVVVKEKAHMWIRAVVDAKMEVDQTLGDTGIIPMVVDENSPKIDLFLRFITSKIKFTEWSESINEFKKALIKRGVPFLKILYTNGPDELVDECNVLVVVKEKAHMWIRAVVDAKMEVDQTLGDTGIIPMVVDENSPKVSIYEHLAS